MSFRRQSLGKINGLNPLIYTGGMPNVVIDTRRPTTKDYIGYEIGTQWIIPKKSASASASDPSQEFWFLVSKRENVGVWKRLRGGGNPTSTLSVNIIVLDTPGAGTYTPSEGMTECIVECVGGGGGGIGVKANYVSGTNGYSGSGGGGYCKKLFTALDIGLSQSYIVGAGGSGGIASLVDNLTAGNDGGDTTFGSFLVAGGGIASGTIVNGNLVDAPGSGGTCTGGDLNVDGMSGLSPVNCADSNAASNPSTLNRFSCGAGGNSGLGMGSGGRSINDLECLVYPGPTYTSLKNNGIKYGGGASGVIIGEQTFNPYASIDGASGADGVIIITEYIE